MGLTGATMADGVFRITKPRGDLKVTLDGFPITPRMGLAGWVAFRAHASGAMLLLSGTLPGEAERVAGRELQVRQDPVELRHRLAEDLLPGLPAVGGPVDAALAAARAGARTLLATQSLATIGQMRKAQFEIEASPQYFAVLREYLVFLIQVADRLALARLTLPERLTTMRRLYSARPRLSRRRRNFAGPGPRLIGLRSAVRAPAITASTVARSSSRCSWSRRLPKEETARLAVAILPSAVMAMFTNTNGKSEVCGLESEVECVGHSVRLQARSCCDDVGLEALDFKLIKVASHRRN